MVWRRADPRPPEHAGRAPRGPGGAARAARRRRSCRPPAAAPTTSCRRARDRGRGPARPGVRLRRAARVRGAPGRRASSSASRWASASPPCSTRARRSRSPCRRALRACWRCCVFLAINGHHLVIRRGRGQLPARAARALALRRRSRSLAGMATSARRVLRIGLELAAPRRRLLLVVNAVLGSLARFAADERLLARRSRSTIGVGLVAAVAVLPSTLTAIAAAVRRPCPPTSSALLTEAADGGR